MDGQNHNSTRSQPNGIIHRPQSHVRVPPPPSNLRHNELIEEDEFDIPVSQQQPSFQDVQPHVQQNVGIPSNPQGPSHSNHPRSSHHGRPDRHLREASRSLSRDKADLTNALPKILKIAVIGDSTVGKTCLCNAVTLESYNFNKNYQLTCGVSVYSKSVKLPDQEGSDERVNMALLDSSGKDIYLDYLPRYWGQLDGWVIVIDLTSLASLKNATDWLKVVQKSSIGGGDSTTSSLSRVLIGNKVDLVERRAISPQVAQEFASKHNMQYFECSVKENSGLEEPFFYLAHQFSLQLKSADGGKENKWN